MYIDLVRDTTSSLNITEVSDESVNSDIKYSDWRMMIVNMFKPEDQEQFLRRSVTIKHISDAGAVRNLS